MGGTCVQTDSIVDPNEIAHVRIDLNGTHLVISVASKWSSIDRVGAKPLIGLEFQCLSESTGKAIWTSIQDRGHSVAAFLKKCSGLQHLTFQDALELALMSRIKELSRE